MVTQFVFITFQNPISVFYWSRLSNEVLLGRSTARFARSCASVGYGCFRGCPSQFCVSDPSVGWSARNRDFIGFAPPFIIWRTDEFAVLFAVVGCWAIELEWG